ncbi:MAG TPA: stage II sporulation protein M [Gemmatimonadaceae bacterium]|nr:stage II sporulation protein M [Gemmatimonadaceae bacterium]
MAVSTRSLEQVVDVETPEQVVLTFTIAGIGSRAAAAVVDSFILLILLIASSVIMGRLVSRGIHHISSVESIIIAIYSLLTFAMIWGYYVLFEALWDGQTPGKRVIGLRVVRDGGFSITFAASAVRNLTRVLDGQPIGLYFVGLVSAIISPSGKRLGDYAAGTIVVRERAVTERGAAPPPIPSGGTAIATTTYLTDDEFALLDRYEQRRASLDRVHAFQFESDLADRFRKRAPSTVATDRVFLAELWAAERDARARGAAARSDTGAAREQYALVAQGGERWREFAARLAALRRGGLAKLPEQDVSDFVARYRELTTDLARLTTASRGRDTQSLWYLNRLVASGHAMLYRDRPIAPRSVWRFITRSIPKEIRRSWRPIVLAALLLYVPAVVAWVAVVRNPASASSFIPPSMLDRAEEGITRAREGTGYIADDPLMRPLISSAVISNNIYVSFSAFAGGLSAGILTVVALVFNGIELGGVFGLYQSKGILPLIVKFVAPHSVFELTAICIAGGAGFLLAAAILLPGSLTRREALIANGQRAIRLIAGATLLLLCAGTLEGLISPIPWWTLAQKLTVSGLTAVILALYISLGWHDDDKTIPGTTDGAAGAAPHGRSAP